MNILTSEPVGENNQLMTNRQVAYNIVVEARMNCILALDTLVNNDKLPNLSKSILGTNLVSQHNADKLKYLSEQIKERS